MHWQILGWRQGRAPPRDSISVIFMQFVAKKLQNYMSAHPIWELAPLKKILDPPPVSDLGGAPGPAPYGPKCSQFHAVFRKIWQNQNHMLPPPPCRVGAPSYGESWIRPWPLTWFY